MSTGPTTGDVMAPLLGMVAGSIATNSALIALLTKSGVLDGVAVREGIDRAVAEMALDNASMKSGLDSYVASMRLAIRKADSE